jgi:hypothetical protein
MSRSYKTILVIEFILAFLVPVWALLVGIVTSITFGVVNILNMSLFGFEVIAFTVCGCIGMLGLMQLLVNLVSKEFTITNPKKLIACLTFGFFALMPLAVASLSELDFNSLIWNAPVVVALHLIYESRRTLKLSNKALKEDAKNKSSAF